MSKPEKFDEYNSNFFTKLYDYEDFLRHNHIDQIKFENNQMEFCCENLAIKKQTAYPIFTIQKLDPDIGNAIDALEEEFIIFEHKNIITDKLYEYANNIDDIFSDMFKNPYKNNEDTFIFISAMTTGITGA
jgi:hypothetical protein